MKNANVMIAVALITVAGAVALLSLAADAGASPAEAGRSSSVAPQEAHFPAIAADGYSVPLPQGQNVATWSSGWIDIAAGTVLTLTHNLGGDIGTYAVDLWFRDTAPEGLGINQRASGGLEAGGNYYGAYWQNLTNSTIQVVRLRDDVFADQVYVQVWTADAPAWDSGWVDIAAGAFLTLPHSVGGSWSDYVVGLWQQDTTAGGIGINSAGHGGLEMAGQIRGAGWQGLTANTITVERNRDDIWADQVRVRIFVPEPPTWDSGWVNIAPGAVVPLPHNLGGNPITYVVRDWHRDTAPGGIGVNHQFAGGYEAGGNFLGANWQDLTSTTIDIFRFANDWVADQMRVRIWVPATPPAKRIYLPLVLRNHAGPVLPTPTATQQTLPTPTATLTTTEYRYSDLSAESYQAWDIGKGFATFFTSVPANSHLVRARYYLQNPAPVQVHIWDHNKADRFTPFTAYPTADGWLEVDLGQLGLYTTADGFYVGFTYLEGYRPDIGVDTGNPQSHSYEVDGAYFELRDSLEYMIGIVVGP